MAAAARADGSENVIAAARHIIRSLAATPNAADDMMRILSGFDHRLAMPDLISSTADTIDEADDDAFDDASSATASGEAVEPSEVDIRLDAAEKVILHWDPSSPDSLIWDSADTAAQYLTAVDEIIELVAAATDDNFQGRAERVLQVAMTRLEDEFRHLMIRKTAALDAGGIQASMRRLSLSLRYENISDAVEDIHVSPEEQEDQQLAADSDERGVISLSDEQICSLIRPEAISDLKTIADRMITARFRQELCQIYSSVRRDILLECLAVLGPGAVSIEEVQRMEWKALDYKMKRWTQTLKLLVRVILSEERRICNQIFARSEELKEDCFNEAAKVCVMHLLNFGDAIAIGQRSSEKLFRILGMYEALSEVLPDFQALFSEDSKELICGEAEGVLSRLGDAVRATLTEFGNAVHGETSQKALQGGEIHPLSRYVMNYLKLLIEYNGLLNMLLETGEDEGQHDNSEGGESMTPLGHRVLLLISYLEANLEEKSKLYEDPGMQYVFLMNNELYIVQKVKESELKTLLGDHWVRKRRGQIRQYATSYLRASWTKVLSFLKDDGLTGSGSSHGGVSKTVLKEKFKNFNLAFEEIYKIQTAWKVPDPQLREELRISISEKVLPAYRAFVGRFGGQLEGGWYGVKHIKYTAEDLEKYLADFFEGLPASHSLSFRRKLNLS